MNYSEIINILMSDNVIDEIRSNESKIFKLIPELETCVGFDQKNKWHVYDVYEHILKVIEGTGLNKVIRLAALFHDIGKPDNCILDENGVGHFYNHWVTSLSIFKKYEGEFKLSERDSLLIEKLIYYHDIRVDKFSKEEKESLLKEFGYDGIKLLYELKRADLLAQNPDYHYQIDNLNAQELELLELFDNMNLFSEVINRLEALNFNSDYIIRKGSVPILFSAPHTMVQVREDGTVKKREPYTKAISLYLNNHKNTYSIIKINDTGYDSNKDNHDEYKRELIKLVHENNIKVVIDLHGSSKNRDFDVEFGTLNNLTADYSTIKELEEAFKENNITEIIHNDPFKGGAITQYLYNEKDVDVIQLEINGIFRENDNIEKLELLVKSLEDFIDNFCDKYDR